MSDLVTIATFAVPLEAHILRGRLEAEDIFAVVTDENIGNIWSVGPVRVQVETTDAKRAIELKRLCDSEASK